jgi:hypothetical protein
VRHQAAVQAPPQPPSPARRRMTWPQLLYPRCRPREQLRVVGHMVWR